MYSTWTTITTTSIFKSEASRGLPLFKDHDHIILLLDETQTVKLRSYRYPTIQKDEIERMILKMKEAKVIRDNTSSFASQVVLVKKENGS